MAASTIAIPGGRRRSPRGASCEEPPRLWGEEPRAAAPVPARPAQARPAVPTLDDLMSGAWEGLTTAASVACPVCTASMAPRWSAGAGVVGGRCGGCGTTLE